MFLLCLTDSLLKIAQTFVAEKDHFRALFLVVSEQAVWFAADCLSLTLGKRRALPPGFAPALKGTGVFRADPALVFDDTGLLSASLEWPVCSRVALTPWEARCLLGRVAGNRWRLTVNNKNSG